MPQPLRQRAAGILRTMVVVVSTGMILTLCYTLYNAVQINGEAQMDQIIKPITPAITSDNHGGSINVGGAKVGPSKDIEITVYPRPGDRSQIRIRAASYDPVPGRQGEIKLDKPKFFIRTSRGYRIEVVANEGELRAGQRGEAIDPRSGTLRGDVVIKIDRRTAEELKALPEAQRHADDPASIITVTLQEIQFDIEYANIVVPGDFHLTAVDVDFAATDLEVRFDEKQNRVERLRIGRGKRLELRQAPTGEFDSALPGLAEKHEQRVTLVEMLRTTLQERLALTAAKQETGAGSPAAASVGERHDESSPPKEHREDSTSPRPPAFIPPGKSGKEDDARGPGVKYVTHFKDNIDARHLVGDTLMTRLRADELDILRDLSRQERDLVAQREKARQNKAAKENQQTAATLANRECVVLKWDGPLVVEALPPDDEQARDDVRARLTAIGSPVRISHREPPTDATCSRMVIEPDTGRTWLYGDSEHKVMIRSTEHGLLRGEQVYAEQSGDGELKVVVDGPGVLVHGVDEPTIEAAMEATLGDEGTVVEFGDEMDIYSRTVSRRRLDITGTIVTSQERVLERVELTGGIKMRQGDMDLTSDELRLNMRPSRRVSDPVLERFVATGHVNMRRGDDRLTCREVDVSLTADADGRMIPVTATARGETRSIQDGRTVDADEQLVLDFEKIEVPRAPFDPAEVLRRATAAGIDPDTLDWPALRRKYEQQPNDIDIGVRRFQAAGNVNIFDPQQQLEVRAKSLDCRLAGGKTIEQAYVVGPTTGPASVRLRTFSVTGQRIELNVRDEWAEVPGRGKMTFRSQRDLAGRELNRTIPITIEWQERMKYEGNKNHATFVGAVYATSENTTTFQCDRLDIGFEDAALTASDDDTRDWWILDSVSEGVNDDPDRDRREAARKRFGKEPVRIDAFGNARAQTREIDPATGKWTSRATITGPKLFADLRSPTSLVAIEGAGTLLLEDHRPPKKAQPSPRKADDGRLFDFSDDSGESRTLIEWKDEMRYDFDNQLTSFQGDVSLTHITGEFSDKSGFEARQGRRLWLDCQRLEVSFAVTQGAGGRQSDAGDRMSGLRTARLSQFRAVDEVNLLNEEQGESFRLRSHVLVYEKEQSLLSVDGLPGQPAHMTLVRQNEVSTGSWEHFRYNLATKKLEARKPILGQ